jgi:hypothetical protein
MEGLAQIQCHAELREKRVLTPSRPVPSTARPPIHEFRYRSRASRSFKSASSLAC